LQARGYRVIEERNVAQLNGVSRRLAVPQGTTLEDARAEVRALAPAAQADFNHYYRTEQDTAATTCEGPQCASFQLIGWSAVAGQACIGDVAVGVIDTGINPNHETFASARLEVHKLTPGTLDPSRAIHGTAVTALLIGDQRSRSPGLLPGARVVAVDAFHTEAGDERADVYTLVAALDFLAAKGIRVVNLSLAGPPNAVLEETVARLVERDILLVAATGNGGPMADPVYPAAYPGVLGVTAVDVAGNVYRRAGRGPHVDLAAPGVEIWTAASVRGARPKTGTSFAAPFVSAAAAAILAAEPDLTADQVASRLTSSARDLGDPGQDEVFGYGLVQAVPACQTDSATPPDPAGFPAPGTGIMPTTP
jgi:subtilisin family serine protease